MTCQWVQAGHDTHAELLVGNHTLYKHGTTNKAFESDFVQTNEISYYTDFHDIFHGKKMPTSCVAFYADINENKTCYFPTVHHQTIGDNQYQNLSFRCCIANKDIELKWWLNANGELLSLTSMV